MQLQSESLAKFAPAFAKFQSSLMGAKKGSENPFFKSKYADLESVIAAIKDPMDEAGLSYSQMTTIIEGKTCLVTRVLHSSGEWIQGYYPIIPTKTDPQAVGSATTYARRYALSAICGVYQTDDDAEASMSRQSPQTNVNNYNDYAPEPPKAQKAAPKKQAQKPKAEAPVVKGGDAGEYICPFGKFQGQKLKDIPMDKLENYINWMQNNGKEKRGPALELIEKANEFFVSAPLPGDQFNADEELPF